MFSRRSGALRLEHLVEELVLGAFPEDSFSLDDVILGRNSLELVEEVVE